MPTHYKDSIIWDIIWGRIDRPGYTNYEINIYMYIYVTRRAKETEVIYITSQNTAKGIDEKGLGMRDQRSSLCNAVRVRGLG